MLKKYFALFAMLIIVISIYGCETAKGAAEGMKKDWANLKEADAWFRKNYW